MSTNAWIAVDQDGQEVMCSGVDQVRTTNYLGNGIWYGYDGRIPMPEGTIKKNIGRKMTWADNPIRLDDISNSKTVFAEPEFSLERTGNNGFTLISKDGTIKYYDKEPKSFSIYIKDKNNIFRKINKNDFMNYFKSVQYLGSGIDSEIKNSIAAQRVMKHWTDDCKPTTEGLYWIHIQGVQIAQVHLAPTAIRTNKYLGCKILHWLETEQTPILP